MVWLQRAKALVCPYTAIPGREWIGMSSPRIATNEVNTSVRWVVVVVIAVVAKIARKKDGVVITNAATGAQCFY